MVEGGGYPACIDTAETQIMSGYVDKQNLFVLVDLFAKNVEDEVSG